MHIKCTNGSPIVDTLDHLPKLPLFVSYYDRPISRITEQDELGMFHALRLHGRVHHIELILRPSILDKVFVLLDEHFPILEHLSLSFTVTIANSPPLILPKAFLAPNLQHLSLPSISPTRRLRFLIPTASLVNLVLNNIQASSYFRPGLLVARLASLPNLTDITIEFSVPIPRPRTERELLGEEGTPVILPRLINLRFKGISAYLESLVAQLRAPGLKRLRITLFNQIVFALPHLSHLIDITEGLKLPNATIYFNRSDVSITTARWSEWSCGGPLLIRVMCKHLDWQIDCATQICNALIPVLSRVEQLTLNCYFWRIPPEWQNGAIDDTTWHELLRLFSGVNHLHIHKGLLEELSRALKVDEVGLDPGFLPDLKYIGARRHLFTSFIDSRRVAGHPVQFSWR